MRARIRGVSSPRMRPATSKGSEPADDPETAKKKADARAKASAKKADARAKASAKKAAAEAAFNAIDESDVHVIRSEDGFDAFLEQVLRCS